MSETAEKLIHLAAKKFRVNGKTLAPEDDLFKKLSINSIQALELLSELEMEFCVEVPDYELQGVKTFGQLAAVIDRRK